MKTLSTQHNINGRRQGTFKWFPAMFLVLLLTSFVATPLLEAQRRGGSFGGSRGGGFRSSPSYAPNRPSYSNPSYSSPSRPYSTPAPSAAPRAGGSFGGSRSAFGAPGSALSGSAGASAAQSYRKSYGIPRQSTPYTPSVGGPTYTVHNYGNGFTTGLMMGYLAGSRPPFYYYTPFHPAFYYGSPTIIRNPDGTVEAYPPTFSFFKLFIGLLLVGGLAWLVWRIFRRKKSADNDMSQSSFA